MLWSDVRNGYRFAVLRSSDSTGLLIAVPPAPDGSGLSIELVQTSGGHFTITRQGVDVVLKDMVPVDLGLLHRDVRGREFLFQGFSGHGNVTLSGGYEANGASGEFSVTFPWEPR